jgi:hypothetical protein
MRRLLNFFFALVLVVGTGGTEPRVNPEPCGCGCCESTKPVEPCGCGMPSQPSPQRCGGKQLPATLAIARPATAPMETHREGRRTRTEAKPWPTELPTLASSGRDLEAAPSCAFPSGESPPDTTAERLALLSCYRI